MTRKIAFGMALGSLLTLVGPEAFGDSSGNVDRGLPDQVPVRDIG